ncbi:MAG TPA: ubiquinone biosynthesis regulatory protein kinase UbiB [Gammaproteobacteria bacterium]|nr:ubiquinone biosynthesis regulatory protein kinase UbiB [Gammaproteobacteria bacterium]
MKQFSRLIHIFWIISKRYSLLRLRHKKSYTRGSAMRLTLEELGPVFVKFGQALSTRHDLLPKETIDELAKLQDQVPAFSNQEARQRLEKIYHAPLEKIFKSFEETPLASASVAQVHGAVLKNEQSVVIKILRPRIKSRIKRDIALMYSIAKWAVKFKRLRQFKPKEMVAEFEESILGELDLLREAGNASQLRRNFLKSDMLYVPEIYWDYTHVDVLVMERIHGIPIRHIEELKKHNINMKLLAERGIEVFFTQVFRDNFFHADMHPGNIFVSTENGHLPKYIVVDFGIMGSLSPRDQRYIAENFLAFFKRDYRRVALLHIESGWAPENTRVDQLETAIRTACEPIFEKPLGEISFGQLLFRLFQMASKFDIRIQPQLILLQKTLLSVEGLARQLYPHLDLWTTAKPFLEAWIKTQIGPKAFFRKLKQEWPQLMYGILAELKKRKDSVIHE